MYCFGHILVLVLDSFLGLRDLQSISRVNKFHDKVVPKISRLLLLDLRPLLEPHFDYENQVAVDTNRVDMGTSLALRSGLDPGRVVRTLGGEYTGALRDFKTILHEIESVVNLEDYQHIKRMLIGGGLRFENIGTEEKIEKILVSLLYSAKLPN